jgi:hypothetical protein
MNLCTGVLDTRAWATRASSPRHVAVSVSVEAFVRQPLTWAFAVGHPDRAVRSAAVRVRPLARR